MDSFPLVDLQVNGWGGVDFSDPDLTAGAVTDAATGLEAAGTAAFLATVVSAPVPVLLRNVALLAGLAATTLRGRLLGVHLEGPFIAPDPRVTGAHRAEHVHPPDTALLARLLAAGDGRLRVLTVAAEVPGAEAVIRAAAAAGVAVSIGHSYALRDDLAMAVAAGAVAMTHLGNALPERLPRQRNPLLSGLLARDLTAMVIADGHHLSDELLALVVRAKGADRMVLVSDTAPVAGLAPGRYRVLGQDAVLTRDGAVVNEHERHLVGSATCLLDCVDRVVATGDVTRDQAAAMASATPLALLGLTRCDLAGDVPLVRWDPRSARLARCR